jgi:valyl-tRNA synthetase
MEIPSKYNPKEVEEKIYKNWLKEDLFSSQISLKKKPFSIVIPPPNITGILHMGHALNNTIQDVLIRFKRMQGYQVLWMPGTDHAGIATQNVVEKELAKEGLRKEDIGREEFAKRLWAWTQKYGNTILEQLKRLGASCDWKRKRFTLDKEYSEAVKEVFVKLYEKGLVYRGKYIINWCPRCKTALSDEESPHKEIDGWLYYIRYPIKKENREDKLKVADYIVVATTRPETMLADTAVAINPKDSRFKWLKNVKVILPIINRELKVVEDELVDPEFGTGVVKVTPAHDPVDFVLAKKHSLEFINIMNEDATLSENAAKFKGLDRFKAREEILKELEKNNLLEKKEPYKINAGHCYRCNTIIEPRLSLQWFVRMRPLAKEAIKVVEEDKIKFYPLRWKKIYLHWMYNINDWCISRQIWWGHQIPVYYCKNCFKDSEKNEGIIVAKEKPSKCPKCGGKDLYQDQDVLDTWFSSWLWPFATFGWPKVKRTSDKNKPQTDLDYFYPTNVLVTASEILFFWVARMIMAGLEFMKEIPFSNVLIHGTVRDEKGIKMSKSLGNIIDPLEIIEKYGADALRFSLMMLASTGADVYLSDEKFIVGRNFCNKLWNASRLLLLKIKENNLRIENLDISDLDSLDKWIIYHLNQTIQTSTSFLGNYRLSEAIKIIYEFFWHIFCDWYLEMIKEKFSLSKAKVSLMVLINCLKLLSPFIPFITEEIYQLIKKYTLLSLDNYLMISSWPKVISLELEEKDKDLEEKDKDKVEKLIETIKEIRNIKINLGLGTKKVGLEIKTEEKNLWERNRRWIMRLSNSECIEFKENLKRTLYKNDFWEIDLKIEELEVGKFIASLEKKINDLEKILERVSLRINNENFLRNAPKEKVEEEKIRFKELSLQMKSLKELKDAFK